VPGLELFRDQYKSRTWIDHGGGKGPGKPYSNDEDLAVLGWDRTRPETYILELLHRFGYDYAWAYFEQGRYLNFTGWRASFNLLQPEKTYPPAAKGSPPWREIPPLLFYYNRNLDDDLLDAHKLYLFDTYPYRMGPKGDNSLYSPAMVDTLVKQRGVHMSHNYFGAVFQRGYLYEQDGKTYRVSHDFDEKLADIAQLVKQGRLWNPTVSEFGDYLTRAISWVDIRYESARRCVIANNSGRRIPGFSIAVRGVDAADVIFSPPTPFRHKKVGDDLVLWWDMKRGERRTVEFRARD